MRANGQQTCAAADNLAQCCCADQQWLAKL
jgi:hypothetical protein